MKQSRSFRLLLLMITLSAILRAPSRKGNVFALSFQWQAIRPYKNHPWMRRLPSLSVSRRIHLLQPCRQSLADGRMDRAAHCCRSTGSLLAVASEIDPDPAVLDNNNTANEHVSSSLILRDLNPSQIEAVTQPLSAITRVVAGPGSGKTRVLTCRIAYLLEQDESSRRILGVTFTRKAAGEMQQRLQGLLADNPERLSRVTLGTFHSVCAKILRWNGELLGSLPSVTRDMMGSRNATLLDGNFVIIDQSESLRVLKECLNDAEIDLKNSDIKPVSILSAIGDCKAKLAQGEDPFLPRSKKERPLPRALQVALKVYQRYREKLLAANCVDFDDLIYMTRELLLYNEEIQERLQRRWSHVLVDEFQDTSRTQMDLVKLLTSSSLFVVGDADQSIYSWRGAHVGSLSDFADEFCDHLGEVSTVYLMENYRSTSNIVEAAQRVISRSGGKTTGADKLRQSMKPKRGAGPSPRIIACADEDAEAKFVVETVKERIDNGAYNPNSSVAVIYRTNAQSRALEEACVSRNVPYVIFGSATSFYKRQEVKDCLCFLRWLHNGRDRIAMLRAMTTPKRGIGDSAMLQFDAYCAHVEQVQERRLAPIPTPFDVLLSLSGESSLVPTDCDPSEYLSTRPLKLLTEFSGQMRMIRDAAIQEPVEKVLSTIIEKLELIPYLDKISKSNSEFNERKANVEELRLAASRHDNDGPCIVVPDQTIGEEDSGQSPLANFLDDVSLVTDLGDSDDDTGSESRFVLNLMTIHASKGMEFDAVFVVGVEEGTLPTAQAIQEGEGSVNLDEEKRLCYVAMTRAKTELCMTWRREVQIFTNFGIRTVSKDRSRFLDVLVSRKGKKTPKSTKKSSASTAPSRREGTTNVYSNGQNASSNRRMFSSPARTTRSFSTTQRYPRRSQPPPAPSRRTPKFEGTTDILGKQRRKSPLHLASPASSPLQTPTRSTPAYGNMQRRVPGQAATPRMSSTRSPAQRTQAAPTHCASAYMNHTSPPKTNKVIHQFKPQPNQSNASRSNKEKKEKVSPEPAMDSTWFFPVGSEVMHKDMGKGIVLNPPPPPPREDKQNLVVRVQFDNGDKREFPLHGTDLSPIVL